MPEPEVDRRIVLVTDERDELRLTHIVDECFAFSESLLHGFAKLLTLFPPAINRGSGDTGLFAGYLHDRDLLEVLEEELLLLGIFHIFSAFLPVSFSHR